MLSLQCMAGMRDLSIFFQYKHRCKVSVRIKCRSEEVLGHWTHAFLKRGLLQWTVSKGRQCTDIVQTLARHVLRKQMLTRARTHKFFLPFSSACVPPRLFPSFQATGKVNVMRHGTCFSYTVNE